MRKPHRALRGRRLAVVTVGCLALLLVIPAVTASSWNSPVALQPLRAVAVVLGPNPVQAVVTPNGSQVWVTDALLNTVYVVNSVTLQVEVQIPLPAAPYGLAFSPAGSSAWISARYPNMAIEVSTSNYSVVATVPIPVNDAYPYMIAVNPGNGDVWVSDYYHNITIINGTSATIESELLVLPPGDPGFVTAMAFGPNGQDVFVGYTAQSDPADGLVAYNASTGAVVWSDGVEDGGSFGGIAVSSDGRTLFALNDSTPGAEFSFVNAQTGAMFARTPLPAIRIEDFSTPAFTCDSTSVWFAASQPGIDGLLVGVSVATEKIVVEATDSDIPGSTSLSLTPSGQTAFAVGVDGAYKPLVAWSPIGAPSGSPLVFAPSGGALSGECDAP